jgi:hypothetical protein
MQFFYFLLSRRGIRLDPAGSVKLLNRGTCIWRLRSWECILAGVCAVDYTNRRAVTPPWLLSLGGQHKVANINLFLWRPFTSVMIGSRRGDPSGLVPSLTMGFHGWMRHRRDGDGAGPRRVFIISSNLQDLVVSFNLFRILFEYCNFTALT